jgi:hypothetical protein
VYTQCTGGSIKNPNIYFNNISDSVTLELYPLFVHNAGPVFRTPGISLINLTLIISLQMPIIGNYMSDNDNQDFNISMKTDQSVSIFIIFLQGYRDKSKTKQMAARSRYGK